MARHGTGFVHAAQAQEICTQKLAGAQRHAGGPRPGRRPGPGLAGEPGEGVDADRLAIVGWSNGGSTVLSSVDASQQVGQSLWPKAAVAFYRAAAAGRFAAASIPGRRCWSRAGGPG